ncbi:MAG: hypothetical protein MJ231_07395, partial [bacterium]|nr:hypothetical protein [bacterium]
MKLEKSSFFDSFVRNINKNKSFTLTGLTSFSRLLLAKYIASLSNKKVLFVTSTEQTALKYSVDLERLFGINSEILTYQNTSSYETLQPNIYDYSKQVSTLLDSFDFVIAPVKVFTEKFPTRDFYEHNSLKLKLSDNISQKNLLDALVTLGYKRATMVTDIGEFSIRGDIADIYTLSKNPVRIEFWGDEIVDIRYFNNETQKSIEKIQNIAILPLYKFVLPQNAPSEFSTKLHEQFNEEGYFEGVNVYQSYFNSELTNAFEYFKDYVVIFDEYAEISAKLNMITENNEKNYNEALKTGLIEPLKELNHFSEAEIIQQVASFQKIYLNNFLSDENTEVIDVDARNLQI